MAIYIFPESYKICGHLIPPGKKLPSVSFQSDKYFSGRKQYIWVNKESRGKQKKAISSCG